MNKWIEQIGIAIVVSLLAWMTYTLHDNSKTLAVIGSQVDEMRHDAVRSNGDKTATNDRIKELDKRLMRLEYFIEERKKHEQTR